MAAWIYKIAYIYEQIIREFDCPWIHKEKDLRQGISFLFDFIFLKHDLFPIQSLKLFELKQKSKKTKTLFNTIFGYKTNQAIFMIDRQVSVENHC